ncbi:MAG: hypothetical protein A2583_01820 [Bdellovibrionales bacterium RIFOXYD1_FULL_53_11]|nr:MAG: hypothetical protein A2583_01820 [Bdellovibrionales bacterium RIFOXYD1_FULL_53_11]
MEIPLAGAAGSSHILAVIWGLFVFFSLSGYGLLFSRWLEKRGGRHFTPFFYPIIGFAVSLLAGGILNVLRIAYAPVVLAYVIAGFVALLSILAKHFRDKKTLLPLSGTSVPVLLLFLCLATLRFLGSGMDPGINMHDDAYSYIVFPGQMLQNGVFGMDIFATRRMESAMGSGYFIQAFQQVLLNPSFSNIIEPGVTGLILFSTAMGVAIRWRMGLIAQVFLGFLCYTAEFAIHKGNTTSITGASALMFFLLHICTDQDGKNDNLLVALIASGIFTLKSTLVPPVVTVSTVFYVSRFLYNRSRTVVFDATKVALLTFLMILPWMILCYQASGTLLFPVFGRGMHASAFNPDWVLHGEMDSRMIMVFVSDLLKFKYSFCILVFVSFFVVPFFGCAPRRKILGLVLVAAVFLAVSISSYYSASSGIEAVRYSAPVMFACVLLCYCIAFANTVFQTKTIDVRIANLRLPVTAVMLICFILIMSTIRDLRPGKLFKHFKANLHEISRYIIPDRDRAYMAEKKRLAGLQAMIPEGSTILVRMRMPFLMNFRSHRIFVPDWPGANGPAPGIPSFQGPRALFNYLKNAGILYVMYDYASEAGFSYEIFKGRLAPYFHLRVRTNARYTFDFQKSLSEFRRIKPPFYDDSETMIVKL